jgi:hypothetical protein
MQNKNLLFVDKARLMQSANMLSSTIEGLLENEKDKISEMYESQLKASTLGTN